MCNYADSDVCITVYTCNYLFYAGSDPASLALWTSFQPTVITMLGSYFRTRPAELRFERWNEREDAD